MKPNSKENLIITSLLTSLMLSSIFFLLPQVSADSDSVDRISVNIPVSCSLGGTVSSAHTAVVQSSVYVEDVGETLVNTTCNDNNGFSVYAIGYTNDTYGSTVLANSETSANDIPTGLATSGDTSGWSMKLTAVEGTYAPTITSDTNGSFSVYHVIPSVYTKVATFGSPTDNTAGGAFKTTYAIFAKRTQPAGSYQGKVKYTLVHPHDGNAPQPTT